MRTSDILTATCNILFGKNCIATCKDKLPRLTWPWQSKLSFSFLFPCFVFEIFQFLWYANYTYDVVYGEWHIAECYISLLIVKRNHFKMYMHGVHACTWLLRSNFEGNKKTERSLTLLFLSVLSNKTNLISVFSSPLSRYSKKNLAIIINERNLKISSAIKIDELIRDWV